MANKLQMLRWQLHIYKQNKILIYGLKNGLIRPYDNKLIEKLRTIYTGGIPASIILLCDGMTNGHCYDRALLMSRAFLDTDDDVRLVYASVNSLKLNPNYINIRPLYSDHCFVERTTSDGQHLIYDTSTGFIYDKKLYWQMEHPKIRKTNEKEAIIKFLKEEEEYYPEDIQRDKYAAPLIIPNIEMTYGKPYEMYSHEGIELLQKEIEYYKKLINYDDVVAEIESDMKALRLGRKR